MISMARQHASRGEHTSGAHREDQDEGEDMEGRVVVAAVALRSARWTLLLLPTEQLRAQQMRRDVYPLQAWAGFSHATLSQKRGDSPATARAP
jgi:hypothetical protein